MWVSRTPLPDLSHRGPLSVSSWMLPPFSWALTRSIASMSSLMECLVSVRRYYSAYLSSPLHYIVLSGAGASGIPTDTTGGVDTTGGGDNAISPEAAAGIAIGVSLLVAVPVGVVLGCCGMWFIMRSQGKKDLHGNEGEKRELGAIYEDPNLLPAVETAITISENEAYGQVLPVN